MRVMNMSSHPWDTDTGGVLAPGETGEAGTSARIRDAIATGQLVVATDPPVQPAKTSGQVKPRTADKGTPQ